MRMGGVELRPKVSVALVLLMCLLMALPSTQIALTDTPSRMFSGTPDRVVFSSPVTTMSADEVVNFTAIIYDAVNNVLSGNITWSSSNGTITKDGYFFPWSSGLIQITAEHNGLRATHNISVTPGVPTQIEIKTFQFSVLTPEILRADLLDSRGNRMTGAPGIVWDIDGDYIGHGSPTWTPQITGDFSARARYKQLQDDAVVTVQAGAPYAFVFDQHLQVRAGTWTKLTPHLVDVNGYEMPLALAGTITWQAQTGSFNQQNQYHATQTGEWLISATAGNVSGSTTVQVIPGDAVASTLRFAEEVESFKAGESYELVFERRDMNGFIGLVSPSLDALQATSGGLSIDDDLRVYWSPSAVGSVTLTGVDGIVSSSLTVQAVHGSAIDVRFRLTPANPTAGDQVVIELQAEDIKGNRWIINGDITRIRGNASALTPNSYYTLLSATAAEEWQFNGNWFDNVSETMFATSTTFTVRPGRLAFITLQGEGAQVPADGVLDLAPTFFDAYGNEVYDITLNWTIDGRDITLDMLLNDGQWVASTVGGHEIRVNADGVFATIRFTVVAGDAHALRTDVEGVLIVRAGEPYDIFIEVVDIHGNIAESTDVTTAFNTSVGELHASQTGLGYWQFSGKIVGNYQLILEEAGSTLTLPLEIVAGEPVRIASSMSTTLVSEGDEILFFAVASDAYGNTIPIPDESSIVTCTAGDVSFVTNGTWKIEVSNGGTDRSCTIRWNGLLAQTFFDVDEVLLGGVVGSTNTAMSMAAVLLGLLLAVLIVLNRKASDAQTQNWLEEEFDDEPEHAQIEHQTLSDVADTTPAYERHGLTLESMKRLAQEAARVGVMQATPSTVQGQTGWYVDVSEELQYWEVTPQGEWVRHP